MNASKRNTDFSLSAPVPHLRDHATITSHSVAGASCGAVAQTLVSAGSRLISILVGVAHRCQLIFASTLTVMLCIPGGRSTTRNEQALAAIWSGVNVEYRELFHLEAA